MWKNKNRLHYWKASIPANTSPGPTTWHIITCAQQHIHHQITKFFLALSLKYCIKSPRPFQGLKKLIRLIQCSVSLHFACKSQDDNSSELEDENAEVETRVQYTPSLYLPSGWQPPPAPDNAKNGVMAKNKSSNFSWWHWRPKRSVAFWSYHSWLRMMSHRTSKVWMSIRNNVLNMRVSWCLVSFWSTSRWGVCVRNCDHQSEISFGCLI